MSVHALSWGLGWCREGIGHTAFHAAIKLNVFALLLVAFCDHGGDIAAGLDSVSNERHPTELSLYYLAMSLLCHCVLEYV